MKNGEKPAYPQSFAGDMLHGMLTSSEKNAANAGMSKREMFAMAAMQGILSNDGWPDNGSPQNVANAAVCFADELLKLLES